MARCWLLAAAGLIGATIFVGSRGAPVVGTVIAYHSPAPLFLSGLAPGGPATQVAGGAAACGARRFAAERRAG